MGAYALCSILERRGDRFEQATANRRECCIEGMLGDVRCHWNIKDLVIGEISSDIEKQLGDKKSNEDHTNHSREG